jgi:hypothetical protein
VDLFQGEGWEAYDHGVRTPPQPARTKEDK